MKIMKIIDIHVKIMKNEKLRNPFENYENHENHTNPYETYKNQKQQKFI